jgi:hypothetical protein
MSIAVEKLTAAAPHRDGYFRKSTAAAMGFRKIF